MAKRGIILILAVWLAAPAVFAQTSMHNTNKYTFSTVAGWLNWETSDSVDGCYVNESLTALEGYLWCEGAGWIHLNPTNAGVSYSTVDTTAYLSGYAYSVVAGWINFDPTGTGQVTIDLTFQYPLFQGYAWSEGLGWISMEGAQHTNQTDGTLPIDVWMLY
jgi:hypothetical protein